jgi:hypothetical protein
MGIERPLRDLKEGKCFAYFRVEINLSSLE